MEAAGLAIGITALYKTCRDCYSFFTTVSAAEADSSTHLRELEIQQSILKAWGFHWRIQSEDGIEAQPELVGDNRQKRTKLHEYLLRNRFKAEGVFSTLSALADTLSNQEKLVKRYGIKLQPRQQAIQDESHPNEHVQLSISNTTIEDVNPVISEIKNRLSVLNKFKWALKDREDFKKLIVDLRSHSESLYRLCPENAFEAMNMYLTLECLARLESPAGLKSTSRLATQQAEIDETSTIRNGYALLASAANLKASVNEHRGGKQTDKSTLATVTEEMHDMRYLGKGLAIFKEEVVYVEKRDYRGPPLELSPEQQLQQKKRRRRQARLFRGDPPRHSPDYSSLDDSEESDVEIEIIRPADPKLHALITSFVGTFRGANMSGSVNGLDIAGMIDHTDDEHKGHCSILYKLPGSIGSQSRGRPAEDLKLRAPVTLESLLGFEFTGVRSRLGARFELAKKLVRALCMLHSSGWLHKNIRAESVMFFPEHASALREDRDEKKIEIDVSNPILMGYIFSRPDDIIINSNKKQRPLVPKIDEPEDDETSHGLDRHRGPMQSYSTSVWVDPRDERSKSRKETWTAPVETIYGRNIPGKLFLSEKTRKANISGFALDYYQHPAKHADPKRLYRHAYDVYSLGILLLEVGLWEKLRNYEDSDLYGNADYDGEDHYERRRWICREYLDRLRWLCGDTYADVVLSCLMIDSSDDQLAKASERELCARIVADLEGCQA